MIQVKKGYVFIDGGYLKNAILRDLMRRKDISDNPVLLSTFIKLFGEKYWDSFSDIAVSRILYYDAIVPSDRDPNKHSEMLRFFKELKFQLDHFDVKLGDLIPTKEGYRQKGVDVLISIDMTIKAFLNHYDVAILVAGDRDFVPAVNAVREFTGKMVYCIYAYNHIAEELLGEVDVHVPVVKEELDEISAKIK